MVYLSVIALLIQKNSTPLYFLPSICSMSLKDNLTCIVFLPDLSHISPPLIVLASLIMTVFPYKSFLRTNPKNIYSGLSEEQSMYCKMGTLHCDIVLLSSIVSISASPITDTHTMKYMHVQPRYTLACIAIVIVG